MPKISVIVPVYKVEAYLQRCVSSILSQRFTDFEMILVDDGSPDGCGLLCDGFAREDARVHVIHRENGGLSAARNSGIDWVLRRSDSQWLAFVDSDDWIHPDYLTALYQAVTEQDCLISACGCQRTGGEPLEENQDLTSQVLTADDYYCGSFHGRATPVAWNKLYSRGLFETLRYPEGKLHEDEFTTYLALYQAGKVAATSARLYAYFQNQEGITLSKWNPRRLDVLEGMAGQLAYAEKTGNGRLLKKVSEAYIYTACDHLGQADRAYRPMLRRKLRRGLRLGRHCGSFPFVWGNVWAYEAAYPCRVFWWLFGKCRRKRRTHGR